MKQPFAPAGSLTQVSRVTSSDAWIETGMETSAVDPSNETAIPTDVDAAR
jgi:hypothetical protein